MHSKVFKKICNIFLDILIGIFGVILLITIYNDVQVKVLNKSYADFFGYSTFEVQTGSMRPAINVNDLVIVKKDDSPKIKDIITYKKGKEFITHRVVEAYKETYVTRGDANNTKDEAIKKNQIVGKVVKIIPNFGAFRKTLLSPVVLITLIVSIYIISRLFSTKESMFTRLLKKNKKVKEAKPVAVNISDFAINEKDEDGLVRATADEEQPEILDEEQIEELKQVIEETEEEPDEEKTIFFRTISVDSSDLNPVVPAPRLIEEGETEPIVIDEEIKEEDEEVRLKKLKKKHKKFNSIIEKAISIKEEELNEIINVFDEPKLKPNEATIKENFLKIYMEGKYFNYCGNITTDSNSKNTCSKLEEVLIEESAKMIKDYKGNDVRFDTKVLKYKALFIVLANIEYANASYEDIDTKVSVYKKKISKYLEYEDKELNNKIKDIISIQRIYKKIFNDTVESVDTNTFILNYNQLTTKKNIYGLVLDHNITFSKVYSNYIISKTYDEGVVAEDKVLVILNILLSKIAKDMIDGNFKNKYLLYLPASIYDKGNKLGNILKLLDNEFIKESVLILVKSSVIVNKKKVFKDIKKEGYQIAIVYDNNPIKIADSSIYSIATYIFIDKKVAKEVSFDSVESKAIVLENILDKVDIPGGEE
ncbi:MAG: signal peptidase I [Bacilli bacterium]|nr:signal peptidase I [Bacilli bacterium]